jgi:dUTP pyrophosphatase
VTTPSLTVRVRRLDPSVPLPQYIHPGDAGADLTTTCEVTLKPGQRALIPTGIAVEIPDGYVGFVHPRSGLAIRSGLGMVNAPGTIDSGYRGEIKLILVNLDPGTDICLGEGERVAQLIIQRVERAAFVEASDLSPTDRGADGHGSTGGAVALVAAREPSEVDGIVEIGRGDKT